MKLSRTSLEQLITLSIQIYHSKVQKILQNLRISVFLFTYSFKSNMQNSLIKQASLQSLMKKISFGCPCFQSENMSENRIDHRIRMKCLIQYYIEISIMSGTKQETRVKLLIIGQSYVGKSSLLTQYVDEEFSLNHTTTIGVEYKQKTIKLEDGNTIRVQIWDTAGTTRYNTITPNYYRNVDGILLVFDISNKQSFEMINFWIKQVNEKTDVSKIDLLLVGNKIDLQGSREVNKQAAKKVSDQIGIVYIETSAKALQTTKGAFDQLVTKILKRKKKFQTAVQGFSLQKMGTNKKKEDSCC